MAQSGTSCLLSFEVASILRVNDSSRMASCGSDQRLLNGAILSPLTQDPLEAHQLQEVA